jgi:Icc-related predicted phosphoesterase
MRDGMPQFIGAGSTAVRAAVEKYQPLIGLHGHIHESRGIFKLGKTLCINPGSEYGEGILRGVLITLNEKGLKGYQFTSG